MEKIKIFYAITKGNWGGAQKYVYDLATHLSPEEFSVSVIAGQPGVLCEKLKTQNIPVYTLESLDRDINLTHDLTAFWELLKILREHKPDILHLNSPKMGLLGVLAGRLAGVKKIIYTSHGWPFLENRNWFSKIFFKTLCWKIILLSHQTICISQTEKNLVRNWLFVQKKLSVVYNGVENINFLDKKLAREKLNLPETSLVLGVIAELHQNKGLTYLLDAMAEIRKEYPNLLLIIIGEGEERKNLEAQIAYSKLQNQVTLVGNIPNAPTLLPAFDIFVLPSIKEGLPYVILEAGLASLPVIASDVGGIHEVIEPEKTGLLTEAKNVPDLILKIQNLISDPEMQKIYGENLKEKVERDFSLEKMVRETEKLYK